jgi:hypothetical protein
VITFDDIYKTLQEELTPDWVVGRTVNRSCITLKNKHISDEIQRQTRTNIKVQFWSSDTKYLKFEFASDKQHIDLRKRLASSFEEYLFKEKHPIWLRKSKIKGCSTVANVIISEKDDTAKTYIKDFYKLISDNINMWSLDTLPELLSHETIYENITRNEQTRDNSYLPSKEDIETAYRMLANPGNSINIDTVLDQIEGITKNKRFLLKKDWRIITENNIEIWSKKS